MKKFLIPLILSCTVLLTLSAFDKAAPLPHDIITQRQQDRLQYLITALDNLKTALDKDNKPSVQQQYLLVRKAFKQWEYLAEYQDPSYVKDNINGAPLPKIERNTYGLNIWEPRGMQPLDEMIFTEEDDLDKPEISRLIDKMVQSLSEYRNIPHKVYDRIVIEATRIELIRLYTLGLTGFDVPASGNAIPDAINVLETIQNDLMLYKDFYTKINTAEADKLYNTLQLYINYLNENNDFDKLDRLHILQQFVNPLYKTLLQLHQQSGIETVVETALFQPAHNYLSDNLFANNFLDPSFYVGLPSKYNTPEVIDLGRNLFFDPILSANNKRACANCHQPQKGFTDSKPKSTAMDFEGTVERNAPSLINCVYNERFFYDMRSEALEDQIEHVLTSKKEFNTDMLTIISKLKQSEEYVEKFNKGFKDYQAANISNQTIAFALSAYVSSLRGFNSSFDKYVRGEVNAIAPEVKRGFNLFMGKGVCGTCHFAPVFNGTAPPRYEETESEVLAVPENPYARKPVIDADLGRAKARLKEGAEFYQYSFKTPTVRNAAITAPYMHNGAYKTLDDVVDFYNKGGGKGIGVMVAHQTLPFDSLQLNKQEQQDIVAFMNALTDTTGMTARPQRLPQFAKQPLWNKRKIGGEY